MVISYNKSNICNHSESSSAWTGFFRVAGGYWSAHGYWQDQKGTTYFVLRPVSSQPSSLRAFRELRPPLLGVCVLPEANQSSTVSEVTNNDLSEHTSSNSLSSLSGLSLDLLERAYRKKCLSVLETA
jgi:hypothetical protein